MKKVKFIYNPHSGEGKVVGMMDYIVEIYQQNGIIVIPYRLNSDASSVEEFLVDGESCEHILIAGGDGTINSVVNQLVRLNLKTPIAVLPAGTANDFAKLLGYSPNLKNALLQVINGVQKDIDLGQAGDRYFVNVLSMGLFTDISQKTPTYLKNTFGKLAYFFTTYISTIQELPNFKKIHLTVESESIHYDDDALLIFVFNGRTAGNVRVAYRSDIQDGLLDVIIVTGENIAETINTAFQFFIGNKRDYPRGVIHFKTPEIFLNTDDNHVVDIDGEQGPITPVTIRCIAGGIKMIVPVDSLMN